MIEGSVQKDWEIRLKGEEFKFFLDHDIHLWISLVFYWENDIMEKCNLTEFVLKIFMYYKTNLNYAGLGAEIRWYKRIKRRDDKKKNIGKR